jgi:ABC-type nitrate/sulfonate/bicarbonate transport system substrate-binding protein
MKREKEEEMKSVKVLLVVLMVLMFVVGGGRASAAASEKSKLVIAGGVDFCASIWSIVALKNDFFKAEGITDADFKTFLAGTLMLEALVSGDADYAYPANPPVVILKHAGAKPVILFPVDTTYDTQQLLIRKEIAIQKPEDLYGLKLGFLKGTTCDAMLANICRKYNLDGKKINVINMSPPDSMASITKKEIDGTIWWEPWNHRISTTVPVNLIHTGTTSYFPSNHGQKVQVAFNRSLLVVTEKFIKENPRLTEAIVRVHVKAAEIITKPENYEMLTRLQSDYLKQDLKMNLAINKVFTPGLTIDKTFIDDMEAAQDFLLNTGRIKSKIDMRSIIYSDPLKKIKPEWVKVEGTWKP